MQKKNKISQRIKILFIRSMILVNILKSILFQMLMNVAMVLIVVMVQHISIGAYSCGCAGSGYEVHENGCTCVGKSIMLDFTSTFQLYWWRKCSGAPSCIISDKNEHMSRITDQPNVRWIASSDERIQWPWWSRTHSGDWQIVWNQRL
jgi:hypothetical protein